jgi:RNA polymerase subunit RPABC4/transcription elongation factor Spt4
MRDVGCRHCGTVVAVAECPACGRGFALTVAHRAQRLRDFEDAPLTAAEVDFEIGLCDFCASKAAGNSPEMTVNAGMRQPTCPHCHTEFLS